MIQRIASCFVLMTVMLIAGCAFGPQITQGDVKTAMFVPVPTKTNAKDLCETLISNGDTTVIRSSEGCVVRGKNGCTFITSGKQVRRAELGEQLQSCWSGLPVEVSSFPPPSGDRFDPICSSDTPTVRVAFQDTQAAPLVCISEAAKASQYVTASGLGLFGLPTLIGGLIGGNFGIGVFATACAYPSLKGQPDVAVITAPLSDGPGRALLTMSLFPFPTNNSYEVLGNQIAGLFGQPDARWWVPTSKRACGQT